MLKTPNKPGRHPGTPAPEKLALLVPVLHENEADGEVISFPEVGASWARRFSDADAKRVRENLPKPASRKFLALVHVKQAITDPPMLEEAVNRLARFYRETENALGTEELKVGRNISSLVGLSPEDAYRHLTGQHIGPHALKDAEKLFAFGVGEALAMTINVIWRVKGRARPAIYCLTEEAALYAHKFIFGAIGGCSWCICPSCREPFFQAHPLEVYCKKTCMRSAKKARSRVAASHR